MLIFFCSQWTKEIISKQMFHLLLMIILGEELKATEEVILITRLFQMIKVWMPNCISHLHPHIYDHIFACSQENYKLLKKYLVKRLKLFLNGLLGHSIIFHWDVLLIKKLSHFSVIEHAKAWSYYRYYITHRKAQDWCEQETP